MVLFQRIFSVSCLGVRQVRLVGGLRCEHVGRLGTLA
jgi:hypothetical protein